MAQGDTPNDNLPGSGGIGTYVGSRAEHAEGGGAKEGIRGETAKVDQSCDETREAGDRQEVSIPLYTDQDWQRDVVEDGVREQWRQESRRDYARVTHSPSFRRLQGKTQLFPGHESDFFRNRLTHSLEVAQIAEAIAHRVNHDNPYFSKNPINTRLCATAGLIHDLGHSPFGHNGELALDDKMRKYGGFEGNAQTLRIITRLEKKITRVPLTEHETSIAGLSDGDTRAGLNLT